MAILPRNYPSILLNNSSPYMDIESINLADNFDNNIAINFYLKLFDFLKRDSNNEIIQDSNWIFNQTVSPTYNWKISFFSSETSSDDSFLGAAEGNFSFDYSVGALTEANIQLNEQEKLIVLYRPIIQNIIVKKTDALFYKLEFYSTDDVSPRYEKTGKIFAENTLLQLKQNVPTVNNEEYLISPPVFSSITNLVQQISFIESEFECSIYPFDFLITKNNQSPVIPSGLPVLVPYITPQGQTVYAEDTIQDYIVNNGTTSSDVIAKYFNDVQRQEFLNSKPRNNYFGIFYDFFGVDDNLNILFEFDFYNFSRFSDTSFDVFNKDYLLSLAADTSLYNMESSNTIVEIKKTDVFGNTKRILTTTVNKNKESYGSDLYLEKPYLANYDITINNLKKRFLHFRDFWFSNDKTSDYEIKITYKDEKRDILKKVISLCNELLINVKRYYDEAENLFFLGTPETNKIKQFRIDNIKDPKRFIDLYLVVNKQVYNDFIKTNQNVEDLKNILAQGYQKTFFSEKITTQMLTAMNKFISDFETLIQIANTNLIDKLFIAESHTKFKTVKKLSKETIKASYLPPSNFDLSIDLNLPRDRAFPARADSTVASTRFFPPSKIIINNEEFATSDLKVTVDNNLKRKLFSQISKLFFNNQNKFDENTFFIELVDDYRIDLCGPELNFYIFEDSLQDLLQNKLSPIMIRKLKGSPAEQPKIDLIQEYRKIFKNLVGNSEDFKEIDDSNIVDSINAVFPNFNFLFNKLKEDAERRIFFIYGILYWLIIHGNVVRVEILTNIEISGQDKWKLINPSLIIPNNRYLCRLTRVSVPEIGLPYDARFAFSPDEEYFILGT